MYQSDILYKVPDFADKIKDNSEKKSSQSDRTSVFI